MYVSGCCTRGACLCPRNGPAMDANVCGGLFLAVRWRGIAGERLGQDASDGLVGMGEVPVQHGLQERSGLLYQVSLEHLLSICLCHDHSPKPFKLKVVRLRFHRKCQVHISIDIAIVTSIGKKITTVSSHFNQHICLKLYWGISS